MQFRQADLPAIAAGEITVSFRRWKRPQAKTGKRHRLGDGSIEIVSVEAVDEAAVSESDARAAGHGTASELLDAVRRHLRKGQDPAAQLYRVEFRWLGAAVQPRERLANDDALDDAELDQLITKLERMDARASIGPWTTETLAAIAASPGRRAGDLAAAQGRETARFKTDVRKLKALGLTISLETGYRLSPRGRKVFAALQDRAS